MAIEKKWTRQGPAAFTADGGENGLITVSSVECFKTKQVVWIKSDTQPRLRLEIKRVPSLTTIVVGPLVDNKKRKIDNLNVRQDISSYTVADNAFIEAEEQPKRTIPENDQWAAVYEFEPTVALRTFLVDKLGDGYTVNNPLPVDGTFSVTLDTTPDRQDIQNIVVANANIEFAINLPDGTKRYFIRVRDDSAKGRIAIGIGQTNTKYWTHTRGTIFDSDSLNQPINSTIYMQLSKDNQIVEVISLYKS